MSVALDVQVSIETETCIACGTIFGIEASLRANLKRLKESGSFYCPNGHPQHYIAETEAERLRKLLEAERRRLQFERDQRQLAEKQLAKIKRRVKNGVCPCCQRTFNNLGRHMTTKHPNFKA